MDQMGRLIGERRKRLVASIMGHAEREFFDALTPEQQRDFRRKTLQAIDEFADLMRDVVKVSAEDAGVNEHVIDLLQRIHDSQRAIVKRLP